MLVIAVVLFLFFRILIRIKTSWNVDGCPESEVAAEQSGADAAAGSGVRPWEVFLSHRGPDIKRTFVSHLAEAFRVVGVQIFVDEKDAWSPQGLRSGDSAWATILTAINQSSVHLVVFTPGFADSEWCLDEVHEIVTASPLRLMPVFFNVEPGNMKLPPRLEADHRAAKWQSALKLAGGKSGRRLEQSFGFEATLVKGVVNDVLLKLDRNALSDAAHPVDLKARMENFVRSLQSVPRSLGIYGMGGIGKSTVAAAVYNHMRTDFEARSFLADVRERASSSQGMVGLQQQLIRDLCQGFSEAIDSPGQGIALLSTRLMGKNVLIVVDDTDDKYVSNRSQLELLIPHTLGPRSRVLVTSRDRQTLAQLDNVQEATTLEPDSARQLFYWHAFLSDQPPQGSPISQQLADDVAAACGGLPLALVVMGAHLYGKLDPVHWTSAKTALAEMRNIMDRLKISYKGLSPNQKQMFLDTACFCLGRPAAEAVCVWHACRFAAVHDLDTLRDRCLVRSDQQGLLTMHDQLRDLGREIVKEESPEVSKRSRIWEHSDAIDVLQVSHGPARSVQMANGAHEVQLSNLHMTNLVMMSMSGIFTMQQSLESRALLWLHWRESSMRSLPRLQLPHLVALELSLKCLAQLPSGIRTLTSLQNLDLSGCKGLTELPNEISALTGLQNLYLSGCWRLVKLPVEINELTALQNLNLSGCQQLAELPTEISALKALQTLNLNSCRQLAELPAEISALTALRNLKLSGCWQLAELPTEISAFMALQYLDLCSCKQLAELPAEISALTALQNLQLSGCQQLEKLPAEISALTALRILYLRVCQQLPELPVEMSALTALQYLDFGCCRQLAELPAAINGLSALQQLKLDLCDQLAVLPAEISVLKALQHLNLRGCKLARLPAGISTLTALQDLDLSGCRQLAELPAEISALKALQYLDLSTCQLAGLPLGISMLTALQDVDLSGCEHLVELPAEISTLTALERLYLKGCKQLAEVPAEISALTALQKLNLSGCQQLAKLPVGISMLTALQDLNLRGCQQLAKLPAALTALQIPCSLGADPDSLGSHIADMYSRSAKRRKFLYENSSMFAQPLALRGWSRD